MRIHPVTYRPTVFRAPSEPQAKTQAIDKIELSQQGPSPIAPAPLAQAVVAAVSGPAGPVLADELSRLPCSFWHKKAFHWPWTDAHKPVSHQEAADALNRGDERLRVELEGRKVPLSSSQDLAVLEVSLTGESARALPPTAALMAGHQLLDLESGRNLPLYEAYQQAQAHRPVVAFEDGFPLARLGGTTPPKTRDRSEFERNLRENPAEAAAQLVEALTTDLGRMDEARLYPLPSPLRRVVEGMIGELEPKDMPPRLRLLGERPHKAARALEPLGLYAPKADLSLLQGARAALACLEGEKPEAMAEVIKLGGQRAEFYQRFAKDPLAACQSAVPGQEARVAELFQTSSLEKAVEATNLLGQLKSTACLDRGAAPLAERLEALATASRMDNPEPYYDLYVSLLHAGNSSAEARSSLDQLITALLSGRDSSSWDFEENVAAPAREFVTSSLAAPQLAEARDLYCQELAAGRGALVSILLPQVGSTTLSERIEMMRELRKSPFSEQYYELATGELRNGSSLEQARQRTEEFATAAESARQHQDDYTHWEYTLASPYRFYRDNLLAPGREPARQLFLELLANKQEATSIGHVLPEVPGLDLQQRIEVFGQLQKGRFPQQMYDLLIADTAQGSTLDQARARLDEFSRAAESSRQYDDDYTHWEYTLASPYRFYKDNLLAPGREPARQLFLELLAHKQEATSVGHVLPEVPGLDLTQRIEVFGQLQKGRLPQQMYDLLTADMAQGSTLDQARARLEEFNRAAEASRQYEDDYTHWEYTLSSPYRFYKDNLLAPGREPARQLFLELLASKQEANSVGHVLPEVPGLDLQQRIEVFGQLQKGRFPQQMYDLLTADMAQGSTLDQARARLDQFNRAAEASRQYDDDYTHWEYTLSSPYRFYKDNLLAPGREPARQLFLELLASKQEANSVGHVLPEVPGLDLQQRIEVFGQLQKGKFPQQMYDLLTADMAQGSTLDQARARLDEFNQAAEASRQYEDDYTHWEYTLSSPYRFYKDNLLAPGREPARQLFLELLTNKQEANSVGHVLPEVPGLDLQQRIEVFGQLQKGKFPQQMYDLATADMAQGSTLDQARARLDEFSRAAEASRQYEDDYAHWEYTLASPYRFYKDDLLAPECEPARQLFLQLLAEKKDTAPLAQALTPAGAASLEERLALQQDLGNLYPAAAAALQEGATVDSTRAQLKKLRSALDAHLPYDDSYTNWEYYERPALELFQQAGVFGRPAVVFGLTSGFSPDQLRESLHQLKAAFKQAADNGLDPAVYEQTLEALQPSDQRPLERRVSEVIDAMVLQKSLASESGGNLEVNEDEIWVNDIQVSRQES
ncbi:MAG: hypothetical protein AB7S38_19535 [Vulcanimicrobiota bacterium]